MINIRSWKWLTSGSKTTSDNEMISTTGRGITLGRVTTSGK